MTLTPRQWEAWAARVERQARELIAEPYKAAGWAARQRTLLAQIELGAGLAGRDAQVAATLFGREFLPQLDRARDALIADLPDAAAGALGYFDRIAPGLRPADKNMVAAVVQRVGEDITADFANLAPQVRDEVAQAVAVAANQGSRAAAAQIRKTTGLSRFRSENIGRTETRAMQDTVQRERLRAAGVQEWVWSARPDACPICHILHGQTFAVKDETGRHHQCRCVMVPKVPGPPVPGMPTPDQHLTAAEKNALLPKRLRMDNPTHSGLMGRLTLQENPKWKPTYRLNPPSGGNFRVPKPPEAPPAPTVPTAPGASQVARVAEAPPAPTVPPAVPGPPVARTPIRPRKNDAKLRQAEADKVEPPLEGERLARETEWAEQARDQGDRLADLERSQVARLEKQLADEIAWQERKRRQGLYSGKEDREELAYLRREIREAKANVRRHEKAAKDARADLESLRRYRRPARSQESWKLALSRQPRTYESRDGLIVEVPLRLHADAKPLTAAESQAYAEAVGEAWRGAVDGVPASARGNLARSRVRIDPGPNRPAADGKSGTAAYTQAGQAGDEHPRVWVMGWWLDTVADLKYYRERDGRLFRRARPGPDTTTRVDLRLAHHSDPETAWYYDDPDRVGFDVPGRVGVQESMVTHVMKHEAGHMVDRMPYDQAKALMAEATALPGARDPSEYGMSNPREYIAETFMRWLRGDEAPEVALVVERMGWAV